MTNIGTANYGDQIRRTLSAEYSRNKKNCSETGEAAFDRSMSETDKTSSAQDLTAEKIKAPARWTSASLYKIDHDTPEGYTVNKAALSKVREQLSAEGIDADARTPTHEITDEQMDWLGSRYDLEFLSACSFTHEEYGNFMLDLAYLNVFSLDEVENMYGVMPFNSSHGGYLYKMDAGAGSSGYVDAFNGSAGLIDDEELLAGLMMEYLKSRNAGLSEKEYKRMAERLIAERQDRLTVLERFFSRASASAEYSMNNITREVRDISGQLKEDFGNLL